MRKYLARWLLCATLLSSGAVEADPVDDYIQKEISARRIPGLSLVVVSKGAVVKAAGYGIADLEAGLPASPTTTYKIASISKPIIAAGVMLLVQDGKLRLADPVSLYLADAPPAWAGITVSRLLSHTAGLVRDPTDYAPYERRPIIDIIRSAYPLPLNSAPGEGWLYSNLGYFVLAEIMTKVAGKPWDAFIAERIFATADMGATRVGSTTAVIPNRARGYVMKPTGPENAEEWISVRPSGAFVSTVLDLAKLERVFANGSPLSAENLRQMETAAPLNDGKPTRYGYGWYVDSYLGRRRIHHDGQYPGFRTNYERFPDDDLAVIVLANADHTSIAPLTVRIAGFYAPALEPPPFTVSVSAPATSKANTEIQVALTVGTTGKAAPESLVELEIWDAAGKTVNKQNKSALDFAAREDKRVSFAWTPTAPGVYTLNVGVYGPRFVPNYAWSEKAATFTVK